MAEICEVVPLLEIGQLKIGSKYSKPIPSTEPPQTVCLSGEPDLRFEEWASIHLAVIKGSDRIRLAMSDGAEYQEYGNDIVGLEINTHPALKGKLSFKPTVSVSVIIKNDSRLQLPKNL